jgi:hypothetical protein
MVIQQRRYIVEFGAHVSLHWAVGDPLTHGASCGGRHPISYIC